MKKGLTHVDRAGRLRMVDVSRKKSTRRSAEASCLVMTSSDLTDLPPNPQGIDALHAARLAGIQAAKATSTLIPLCHPLNLDDIDVEVTSTEGGLAITATVVTVHHTGVEMEALTACAVAGLSLLNAVSRVDLHASLEGLGLQRKSGGASGDWGRLVEHSD
ncbi:MAG: cyclic pyranopterin monophosphate synthase MoaC [Acidimicrobiales bacterium]